MPKHVRQAETCIIMKQILSFFIINKLNKEYLLKISILFYLTIFIYKYYDYFSKKNFFAKKSKGIVKASAVIVVIIKY